MYNNHSSRNHADKIKLTFWKNLINGKFICKGIILKSQVNLAMKIKLVIFNTLRERWYRSLETKNHVNLIILHISYMPSSHI